MAFVRAVDTSEVPVGTMTFVEVGGRKLLVANVDGAYYAIDNRCPHLGGSLSEGTLDGWTITRPRHASRFDVTTGKNTSPARIAFLRIPVKDAQSYATKTEGASLFIAID